MWVGIISGGDEELAVFSKMDRAGVVRAGMALGVDFQDVDLIDELVVFEGEA